MGGEGRCVRRFVLGVGGVSIVWMNERPNQSTVQDDKMNTAEDGWTLDDDVDGNMNDCFMLR